MARENFSLLCRARRLRGHLREAKLQPTFLDVASETITRQLHRRRLPCLACVALCFETATGGDGRPRDYRDCVTRPWLRWMGSPDFRRGQLD